MPCLFNICWFAQSYSNRISLGVGALYERGFDATISVEHETKNHNAWEYYLNGYVKYAKDNTVGHITKTHSGTTIAHGD